MDSWWQEQGRFAAVALRQQLCGSTAAVASLAEAAKALLQRSIGCVGGSGQQQFMGIKQSIYKSDTIKW